MAASPLFFQPRIHVARDCRKYRQGRDQTAEEGSRTKVHSPTVEVVAQKSAIGGTLGRFLERKRTDQPAL
jgi:hypothetical protein